jgi:pyrroloquinoline quinone biosynthesis protein D
MAEPSLSQRPRLAPFVRLQLEPAHGQYVLLRPEGVLGLNATGAAILALCDGERSIAAIAAYLGGQYERVAAAEITAFLRRLAQKRLVEFNGPS